MASVWFLFGLFGGSSKMLWAESGQVNPPSIRFTQLRPFPGTTRAEGAIIGDFDGDRLYDILLHSELRLFRNLGGLQFTNEGAISQPGGHLGAAAAGDLDGDGTLDIISVAGIARPTALYLINGGGGQFRTNEFSIAPLTIPAVALGDVDGNGSLDILASGNPVDIGPTGDGFSRLYLNRRGHRFVDTGYSFGNFYESIAGIGDYDGDHQNDLLVGGLTRPGTPGALLFRNEVESFKVVFDQSTLPFMRGNVSWGDINNDGSLDALIAGLLTPRGSQGTNQIFLGPDWERADSGIRMVGSSGVLGDFDNDGDLDIFLAEPQSRATLYLNLGAHVFTNAYSVAISGARPGLAAGDLDNDGDLDLVIGSDLIVLRNDIERTNSAPTVPTALRADASETGINLQWAAATDVEQSAGLTYNLRVGRTPGSDDIMPSMARADGTLMLPHIGNASVGTNWTLRNLKAGTYYWAVQSVDHSYRGSSFSAEETFQVENSAPVVFGSSATDVTPTSAQFRGVLDLLEEETFTWFEYGTNQAMTLTTPIRQWLPATTDNVGLFEWVSFLPPNSTVYYRVAASNRFGVRYSLPAAVALPVYVPFTLFRVNSDTNDFVLSHLNAANVNLDAGEHEHQELLIAALKQRTGWGLSILHSVGFPNYSELKPSIIPGGQFTPAWADFNHDGNLDFAFMGGDTNQAIPRFVWNGGAFNFEEIFAPDRPITNSVRELLAWGDSDNDGDLDLLVGGNGGGDGKPFTRIYLNNRTNFSLASPVFPFLLRASASWADYDNDGRLDLLLSGALPENPSSNVTKLFRNLGKNQFEERDVGFRQVSGGGSSWADLNNDGKLDVLLRGVTESGEPYGAIYRNEGDSFVEVSAANANARGMWGDFDNDGFVDLIGGDSSRPILRNLGTGEFEPYPFQFPSILIQNSIWVDMDEDGQLDMVTMQRNAAGAGYLPVWFRNNMLTRNTAPSTPLNLRAAVSGNGVVLSWDPTIDPNQQGGHSYNVMVGSRTGGRDIVSPHSRFASGRLLVNELGNSGARTNFLLENLNPGTYFWCVQAIDHSYAASHFSAEHSFTIGSETPAHISFIKFEGDLLHLGVGGFAAGEIILEASVDLFMWVEVSRHTVLSTSAEVQTTIAERFRFYRFRQSGQ